MTDTNTSGLTEKALWGGYSRTGNPSAVHDCYYQCTAPPIQPVVDERAD
jgi:hypothetical protein